MPLLGYGGFQTGRHRTRMYERQCILQRAGSLTVIADDKMDVIDNNKLKDTIRIPAEKEEKA